MGDIIDDFMRISKEFDAVKKDFSGIANDIKGGGSHSEVVELWDPDKYKAKIGITYDLCCQYRSDASTCTRCVDICPTHALRLDEGHIMVSGDFCVGCGLCVVACPTSALTSPMLNPKKLYDELAATAASGEMAYVSCSRACKKTPPDGVCILPCVGTVSRELWFSLLVDHQNIAVYLPLDACEKCRIPAGEEFYGESIEVGETWSGNTVGFECDERDLRLEKKYSVERKEFISNVLKKSVGTVSKVNPLTAGAAKALDTLNKHKGDLDAVQATLDRLCGGSGTSMSGKTVKRTLEANRQLLLTALEKHADRAEDICIQVSTTSDACTACADCVDCCPMGARRIVEERAEVIASYCVACGLCSDVCPQKACTLVDTPAQVLLDEITNKLVNMDSGAGSAPKSSGSQSAVPNAGVLEPSPTPASVSNMNPMGGMQH